MNEYNDIYDDPYPALITQQLNPFGDKSDIDFIEQDEASYFAMADDIEESK